MKKFIFKTITILFPFFIFYGFFLSYYKNKEGDLYRIGYVFPDSKYNNEKIFDSIKLKNKYYTNFSNSINNKTSNFDYFIIGDSFSEMNLKGYKNYLGYISTKKVIHFDRFIFDNPIEGLYTLLNSDFFEKYKPKYVILQNVERIINERNINLNKKNALKIDSIYKIIKYKNSNKKEENLNLLDKFFSRDVLRFPLYNINYMFDDNAFSSPVYKVKTDKKLFDINKKEVLFLDEDIQALKFNNNINNIKNTNYNFNELNFKLKTKGIKLIVLISPDKYDIYYDNFVEQNRYLKPIFFDEFDKLKKNYIYIDLKKILSKSIKSEKDIYYYDDSHWSPKASKIVANEIYRLTK